MMELQLTRQKMSGFIKAGDLSPAVCDALLWKDEFVPAEGCLFDYKRDIPADRPGWQKMLKHIAAFHNTYGGYLIFGADEKAKDAPPVPIYTHMPAFDSKQVRDLIRENLSAPIEVQSATISLSLESGNFEVILLHIPKRSSSEPVAFTKSAGDRQARIYETEQVYIRDGDNSLLCTKPIHWKLIYGSRINPYLEEKFSLPVEPLHSNLPDRSFIYQKFVGRQDTLTSLWNWLLDDFSCVRVLAGEGGLGKTSLAYEFAQDICKVKPCGFIQVVWLTAKKLQFRGFDNRYEVTPITHYDSAPSLFRQILIELGMFQSEVDEISEASLPKKIHEAVRGIRSFIVVDDLDSIPPDVSGKPAAL